MKNNPFAGTICALATTLVLGLPATSALSANPPKPVDLGTRLEPFFDEFLIDEKTGDVRLKAHRPEPREVVLVTGQPWEGNTCAYYTIFEDNGLFRMYYRGSHWDVETKKATHPEVVCYAESTDGVHWAKPELGLFEFDGSRANNIVWTGLGTHNFTPFKDSNPDCLPEARYKAIARGRSLRKGDKSHRHGLYVFQSPDGIHWKLIQDEPVITQGAFDSQNLAFWDAVRGEYRDYHRYFNSQRKRDIMTAVSKDFIHWTEPEPLKFGEAPAEHLYTNAIQPYERAPHIFIGFPTRYTPSNSQVEPIFMSSRDGLNFHRWPDAVIPHTAPEDRSGNRSNYMTWGLLRLPHVPDEYSVYATEAYYTGPDSRVRRFTWRIDGFASLHAGAQGGTLTTRPLTFAGQNLIANFHTRAKGRIRAELRDASGLPIPGFSLDDCRPLYGNSIAQTIGWKPGSDLSNFIGLPVRLHLELANADLYSIQFGFPEDR